MEKAKSAPAKEKYGALIGSVVGASVKGASHERSGAACQDSFKAGFCLDGTRFLAVADGHGSSACPYSQEGSKLACSAFCDTMKKLYLAQKANRDELITYLNREGSIKIARAIDEAWKKKVRKLHRQEGRELPPELADNTQSNEHTLWAPVYRQYGTTLLGIIIAEDFQFALQIGDGDICYVDDSGFQRVIEGDKMLGVETHSLSRLNAWEKAISALQRRDLTQCRPAVYLLATDGFCNSHSNEQEFEKTCMEYFETLNQYGAGPVQENLAGWLKETSELGCGDDITVLMVYLDKDR